MDLTKREGTDVDFNCTYVSSLNPIPSMHWIFVDQSGDSSTLQQSTVTRRDSTYDTSHLEIKRANRTDAGTYTCVVENEFSMLSSSPATLTVNFFDGVILTALPNTVIAYETMVTLRAVVTAVPAATEIRLSRNDGPFFSSSDSNLHRPIGTVTVNVDNHVEYKFTADATWNGTISVYAGSATHNDTSTVSIIVLAPLGQIDLSVTAACLNPYLMLQWTASGNGGSDITSYTLRWRRHGDGSAWRYTITLMVSDHTSLTQQGGSHTLTGLESGALYDIQVAATNDFGSRTSDIVNKTTLSVPDLPIVEPQPMSVTETSLEMIWTVEHNGGTDITSYTLTLSTDSTFIGGTDFLYLSVSSHASLTQRMGTWKLTGLIKETRYYVEVEANNCMGSSISRAVSFSSRCNPGTPSRPKADSAASTLDGSVKLFVEAPSERGCGQITGYVVRDSDHNQLISSYSIDNGNVTITITGLAVGRHYAVQVSAINNRSWEGPLSVAVTFSTSVPSSASSDDCVSPGVVAAISVALVIATATVCLSLWWFKTRRGVSNYGIGRTTENATPQSDNRMHESSAYDRVQPAVANLDSDIRMQESRAYVAGVRRQPNNNIPMYETVTEGRHAETQ